MTTATSRCGATWARTARWTGEQAVHRGAPRRSIDVDGTVGPPRYYQDTTWVEPGARRTAASAGPGQPGRRRTLVDRPATADRPARPARRDPAAWRTPPACRPRGRPRRRTFEITGMPTYDDGDRDRRGRLARPGERRLGHHRLRLALGAGLAGRDPRQPGAGRDHRPGTRLRHRRGRELRRRDGRRPTGPGSVEFASPTPGATPGSRRPGSSPAPTRRARCSAPVR